MFLRSFELRKRRTTHSLNVEFHAHGVKETIRLYRIQ